MYGSGNTALYGEGNQIGVEGHVGSGSECACIGVEGSANGESSVGMLAAGNGSQGVALEVATTGTSMPIEVTASAAPVLELDNGGNLTIAGKLTQASAPASVASDDRGTGHVMYSPQDADATVEDVGEGTVAGGRGYVTLDPTFAAVIDNGAPYLVFVTPESPNSGYYVSSRTPRGFEVRSTGSMTFAYRIVARPRGFAQYRRLATARPMTANRAGRFAAIAARKSEAPRSPWTALSVPPHFVAPPLPRMQP